MDWRIFSFALYEFILSFIFGLLTILILFKVLSLTFLKININKAVKEKNMTVAIFAGTIILSVLILVQSSIMPAIDSLKVIVLGFEDITFKMYIVSFGYFLLFFTISLCISLVSVFSAIGVYMLATKKIAETEEIRENNVAVSILLSFIILGMVLFIAPSVKHVLSGMVKYDIYEKTTVVPDKEKVADPKRKNPEN